MTSVERRAHRSPSTRRWGVLVPRAKRERTKRVWSESMSDGYGLSVAAIERTDQPGRVRLKYWNGVKKSYDFLLLRPVRIRRADGTIDADQVASVRQLLTAAVSARSRGRSVRDAIQPLLHGTSEVETAEVPGETPCNSLGEAQQHHSPTAQSSLPAAPSRASTPSDLGDALDEYFKVGSGYFKSSSKQRGNELTFAADLVKSVGADRLLSSLTPDFYEEVWTSLATRYAAWELRAFHPGRPRSFDPTKHVPAGTPIPTAKLIRWGGPAHCEKALEFLVRFLDWSARRRWIAPLLPPKAKWKEDMRDKWKDVTKESMVLAAYEDGPRFDEAELTAVFTASQEGEPRVSLAVDLAAEARLGQVIQTWRDGLKLDEGPYGILVTYGDPRTKKGGVVILLTKEQRAHVDHEMRDGYLRDVEATYRRGKIKNYPLFFGGRLSPYRDFTKPLSPLSAGGLRKLFNALEKSANVSHQTNRGWYGLRRSLADLAQEIAEETEGAMGPESRASTLLTERSLNSITGHRLTASRKRYQKRSSDATLQHASRIRGNTRRRLADGTRVPKPSESDQ